MRYIALATDYDGTLALDGVVEVKTLDALRRLAATGRRLILVTGRQLDDLLQVFPDAGMFDRIVAENGALLYQPQSRAVRRLADPPPARFLDELKRRRVEPLSAGQVVVATEQPQETVVLNVIRELGLELQVIFNKGSVMVLPSSVNKATGLSAALKELALSGHNVAGIGDAENDHAFLAACECRVAVANALDALKAHADHVTDGAAGAGVRELIESLIADDLRALDRKLSRHLVVLGHAGDETIAVSPYGPSLLLAGPSGSGTSSIARGFLERLAEQRYQFCIVDPEGDYDRLGIAVTIGTPERAPTIAEAMTLLEDPDQNVTLNLLVLRIQERPHFADALLPRLQELRARTGRPHWLIVDEAHHLVPESWARADISLPQTLTSTMLITVHPERLAEPILERIDTVIAVGAPADIFRPFGITTDMRLAAGEAVVWSRRDGPPRRFSIRIIRDANEQRYTAPA